jgi:hypothetical protein
MPQCKHAITAVKENHPRINNQTAVPHPKMNKRCSTEIVPVDCWREKKMTLGQSKEWKPRIKVKQSTPPSTKPSSRIAIIIRFILERLGKCCWWDVHPSVETIHVSKLLYFCFSWSSFDDEDDDSDDSSPAVIMLTPLLLSSLSLALLSEEKEKQKYLLHHYFSSSDFFLMKWRRRMKDKGCRCRRCQHACLYQ